MRFLRRVIAVAYLKAAGYWYRPVIIDFPICRCYCYNRSRSWRGGDALPERAKYRAEVLNQIMVAHVLKRLGAVRGR